MNTSSLTALKQPLGKINRESPCGCSRLLPSNNVSQGCICKFPMLLVLSGFAARAEEKFLKGEKDGTLGKR